MENYDFNDYNNNFSEETENLRDNARASSGNEPNNDSFSLNNNSNLAFNNDYITNDQTQKNNQFANPSQTDFNNQTPEVAPSNVKPQFEQFQNQNDVSPISQPSFERENQTFSEQPTSAYQQPAPTFNEQPFATQPANEPVNEQQSAIRFSPNVDTSAPVRYGASSDQVPEQTYKYASQQPNEVQQSESVQPSVITPMESNSNSQEQNPIQQTQPITAREVSTPKETKNTKKYTFFEDTEEDIVIESKKEQKEKLKQQQKEEKIAKKNAKKAKANKKDKNNEDSYQSKTLFAESEDDDLPKTKKKSKNKVRAVSFFKMFFTRLIMLLPVIGILFCFLLVILPKTNKNIRNLALTSILFQAIGYTAIAFFVMNGGLGYLVEWFFDLTGYISWSF